MRNLKLTLQYDGTDFCGWQLQPRGRTVQGVFEAAAARLFQKPVRAVASGRTDSGVHALAQVVNLKTENPLGLSKIRLGLNRYLPPDVRVLHVEEAEASFHARFDAVRRVYEYRITTVPVAVGRQYTWFCRYRLNVHDMAVAAEFLQGDHVFEAFSKINPEEEHYRCVVESAAWKASGTTLFFEICANRFLHGMVRLIVGTLVDAGRGKIPPAFVGEILASRDRSLAGAAAPAQGLFLKEVMYD